MKLNGWRRIGIVLTIAWLAACGATALLEVSYKTPVVFAFAGPPEGVWSPEKGTITIPSGKVVHLWQDVATKKFPEPWNINWSDYPDVPISTRVYWPRFAIVALLPPALLWVLFELGVISMAWVKRGFLER
jgi:hypothetical protein